MSDKYDSYDKLETISAIGHPKHLKEMLNHPNSWVQSFAIHSLPPEEVDEWAHHLDPAIRREVAFHGTGKHQERLKNDPNEDVRLAAYCHELDTLD